MINKNEKSQVEIAREALLRITQEKIPLTPDNFRNVYEKIAGTPAHEGDFHMLSKSLKSVLNEYIKLQSEDTVALKSFNLALENRQWKTLENEFTNILTHASSSPVVDVAMLWRDLLIEVLELGLLTQFTALPELSRKTNILLEQAKLANTRLEVMKLNTAFKGYWRKLEKNQNAQTVLHESLIKLFRLMVENMRQFSAGDHWMDAQIEVLSEMIHKPMNQLAIDDAENNLRALLARQGVLKQSLADAKALLKELASSCVSILSEVAENTGEYQEKIEHYQQQIEGVDDILDLKSLLDGLKRDTSGMHVNAKHAFRSITETNQRVKAADQLIDKLSLELDQASQLAYRDFLTGAYNRRGMEEALEREFSRADRTQHPLCLAMLDIDHFKSINDTLGHEAGDEAIMHLATVIQLALRPTDVLARYGGEEFLVILPETNQETGVQVLTRVQRELTKSLFLHQNEKRLITFSAGVAERGFGEASDPVLRRVDTALYQAKNNGRNQVVAG